MTLTAPRERLLQANGLTHHVLEWNGAESNTTVVLLHGFLDLGWSFERVASQLAQRYHVIAPDFRGHGDTEWVGAGGYYYFSDYVVDLVRLLPQLTRAHVFMVGHSMGGTVASYYAGLFPEPIHKLALLEGIGPPADEPTAAPSRLLEHIRTVDAVRSRRPRPMASLTSAVETLIHLYPRVDVEWVQRLAAQATRPSAEGPPGSLVWKYDPLHRTRSPIPFDENIFKAFIARITCPVLLVDSSDRQIPAASDPKRQSLYPRAEIRTLDDSGHMMQLDQPQALAALLQNFFER